MAGTFRVALSGDFKKADGLPTYPDFDLTPLKNAPGVEMEFLESANPIRGEQLEDFDALILLAHRFGKDSVPKSGKLAGGTDAIFGAKVDGVGYGKWSPKVSASIKNAVAAQYKLLKAGKIKGIPATVK